MAETDLSDLPTDKAQRYAGLRREIAAVLAGETNMYARCASIASMLRMAFGARFFWCGFYLVDPAKPDELVVGPYQGTLGCLRIPFGKGVCGAAAMRRETIIVPDVDAFPGHIACDSASRSEIVVSVFARDGALLGVLDVDATEVDAFDELDADGLQAIVRLVDGD
jgi:L-methionine (R)-S-oxide reductase